MILIAVLVGTFLVLMLCRLYGFRVGFLGAILGIAGFIFGAFYSLTFAILLELFALLAWLFFRSFHFDRVQGYYSSHFSFHIEKWGVGFAIFLSYRVVGDQSDLIRQSLDQAFWKDRIHAFRIPLVEPESMALLIKKYLEGEFNKAASDAHEGCAQIILSHVEVRLDLSSQSRAASSNLGEMEES